MAGDLRDQAVAAYHDDRSFIVGLPKAELHVHLEGTLEPELLFELGRRNSVDLPWESVDDLRASYRFDDLQSFLDLYFQGTRVLCGAQDFHDLTWAYLARARADGVAHAEVFLGPQSFTDRDIAIEEVMEGTLSAIEAAPAVLGMSAALLVSVHRHRTVEEALDVVSAVRPWGRRLGGFGMGGAELGNPPSKFADYFARCQQLGYPTTIHAGEEGPPGYVREAMELGVDRIDHGVSAVGDADLVAELAARGMPLTVCPLSNVELDVVPSLQDHPLPTLLRAGVKVTVSSDDPPYFGGYIAENLHRCLTDMGMTRADLVTMARNSFEASFLPSDSKARALRAIDDHLAGLADQDSFADRPATSRRSSSSTP